MYSRTTVAIAVGLGALLIVGVIVLGKVWGSDAPSPAAAPTSTGPAPSPSPTTTRTGPVALVPVDAPDAASAGCTKLITALPASLTSGSTRLRRLDLAAPAPPATVAWGDAGDPVVLRCGLPRPAELTESSGLREISGVRWLPVSGDGRSTWYVVDRGVYVALTVPGTAGTGPLQEISETTARALPLGG